MRLSDELPKPYFYPQVIAILKSKHTEFAALLEVLDASKIKDSAPSAEDIYDEVGLTKGEKSRARSSKENPSHKRQAEMANAIVRKGLTLLEMLEPLVQIYKSVQRLVSDVDNAGKSNDREASRLADIEMRKANPSTHFGEVFSNHLKQTVAHEQNRDRGQN